MQEIYANLIMHNMTKYVSNCIQLSEKETKFYISEEQITHVRHQWGEKNENLLVLIGGIVGMVILGILLTVIVVSGLGGN